MLPENTTPWHIDYFKLQTSETRAEGERPRCPSPSTYLFCDLETGHKSLLWEGPSLYLEGRRVLISEDKEAAEKPTHGPREALLVHCTLLMLCSRCVSPTLATPWAQQGRPPCPACLQGLLRFTPRCAFLAFLLLPTYPIPLRQLALHQA